jgi:hypothetical protein
MLVLKSPWRVTASLAGRERRRDSGVDVDHEGSCDEGADRRRYGDTHAEQETIPYPGWDAIAGEQVGDRDSFSGRGEKSVFEREQWPAGARSVYRFLERSGQRVVPQWTDPQCESAVGRDRRPQDSEVDMVDPPRHRFGGIRRSRVQAVADPRAASGTVSVEVPAACAAGPTQRWWPELQRCS